MDNAAYRINRIAVSGAIAIPWPRALLPQNKLGCGIRIPPSKRSTIGSLSEMKVTESSKSQNEVLLETSIPVGGASLESILCTEELNRRFSRPPDYEKENSALVKLVSALADSPNTVLQACHHAGLLEQV